MPSANVEAVRRGVAAWNRQDLDAMLREYDPQVHVVDPERAGAGPFVGHDAYRRWYAEWLESWEEYDIEHEAIVDAGDQVVLFQRHVGRAKGSGIEIDHRGALLVGLRDGRIVFHRPYTHRADALEGAGFADGEQLRSAIETIRAGLDAGNRHDIDGVVPIAYVPRGDSVLVELEEHLAHVYTVRDGRPVRFHAFRSPEEAYAALSYPEPR